MKLRTLIATALTCAPFLVAAQPADAAPYCREYTKNIRVGGRVESGYGQACLQPDGDWLITETRGTVDPFDDFYARNPNVTLISREPVYYRYGSSRDYYRPARAYYNDTYYRQGYYYPRSSGVSFLFNFDNDDRRDNRRWNNGRNWDRHDHRDRDRGRDRDRVRGRN